MANSPFRRLVLVYGPPGTGKTTWAAHTAYNAVQRYGSDAVVIVSLTKAAAAEIASRTPFVNPRHVGTLHAICYRLLDHPVLAEAHIADWNTEFPGYSLSAKSTAVGESALDLYGEQEGVETDGDALRQQYDILRHRLTPREMWPLALRTFATKWETWKTAHKLCDFTDLLERVDEEFEHYPAGIAVALLDEAQDSSLREVKLFVKLFQRAETVLVIGDPDQSIFSWRGASGDAFYALPVAEKDKIVLSQSYRLPRAVHAVATRWIRQLSHREEAPFAPRDADGKVRHSPATYKDPAAVLDELEATYDERKSTLLLTTCAYMLAPVIAGLRQRGLPFRNPWKTRGDWNPLARANAPEQLLAFLGPTLPPVLSPGTLTAGGFDWETGEVVPGGGAETDPRPPTPGPRLTWTYAELRSWTALLDAKAVLRHGAKTAMAEAIGEGEVPLDRLAGWFQSDALEYALAGDLEWFLLHIQPKKRRLFDFPVMVWQKRGASALSAPPHIWTSTVHACKGGEADRCFLWPEVSYAAARERDASTEGHTALVKTIYVGQTRAKEELTLCAPCTRHHVNW